MRTHHLKYFLCHHSHSHIIFPWILTCLRWHSNVGSYNIFIEIRIVAHSDIYITVRQMSPSSGNTFHTATHSWDAVLQVALEMAGNEREMAGKKEGKLKGSVSFSFIRSHTHWQPFNMFDFEKKKKPWHTSRRENLDLSSPTFVSHTVLLSCQRTALFAWCCEENMREIVIDF